MSESESVRTGARSASFVGRANESCFWESYCCTILSRAGLYVLHHPMLIGGDGNGKGEATNAPDIEVGTFPYTQEPDMFPVEIKSRAQYFDVPSDLKEPHVFVSSMKSWMRKYPGKDKTQRDFLMVSKETGTVLWLPIGTRVSVTEMYDPSRNETYKGMVAEKGCLQDLDSFVSSIKRRCSLGQ